MVKSRTLALILAGGVGSRLGGLGTAIPKCLLAVGSQTVLQRLLRQSLAAGVDGIVLSVSRRYEELISSFVRQLELPVEIRVVAEATPLGTARALLSFAPMLRDARTLLVLGDEYFADDAPFLDLRAELSSLGSAELVLGTIGDSSLEQLACVVVRDSGGRPIRIIDKPRAEEIVGRTRWACLAALGPGTLDLVEGGVQAEGLRSGHIGDVLDAIRSKCRRARALEVNCFELNINGPTEALLANLIETRAEWRSLGGPSSALDSAIRELAARLSIPAETLPP